MVIDTRRSKALLTGGDRFVDEIEAITGLRLEHRRPGRPKRDGNKSVTVIADGLVTPPDSRLLTPKPPLFTYYTLVFTKH